MKSIFKNTEQTIKYSRLRLSIMYENNNLSEHIICDMQNQPLSINYIKAFNDLGLVMPNLNFPISKMDILDYILNGTIQGCHINTFILESINNSLNGKNPTKLVKSNYFFKYCTIIVQMANHLRNYRPSFLHHVYDESYLYSGEWLRGGLSQQLPFLQTGKENTFIFLIQI